MSRKEAEKKVVVPTQEEVVQFGGDGAGGEPAGAGPNDAAGPGSGAAASPEARAVEEWKEIALRAKADLSNYQKRAERDRTESIKYANAGLARALLPVLDNLERVIQSAGDEAVSLQSLADGVKMTLDLFRKALREHNIEPIEAEGQPFDPMVHEAMMERPSDHAERVVLQELGRGYRLHDRVLRPAKVIVSKPTSSADASGAAEG